MKCPNCASDVPDNSNFCGVCGLDIRAHRAQAAKETLVIDSETRAAMFQTAHQHRESDVHLDSPSAVDSLSSTLVDADVPEEPRVRLEPKPKRQPKQTEEKKPKPAPEVVIETSANTPAAAPVPAGTDSSSKPPEADGGFRETLWFMQAQNPESIEAIDNVDVRHLADSYEDRGAAMDTQVRQQFSLNVSDQPIMAPKPQSHTFDTQAFESVEIPGVSKNRKYIALGIVLLVLGAVGWFFVGK